jgi:hypothetical protein
MFSKYVPSRLRSNNVAVWLFSYLDRWAIAHVAQTNAAIANTFDFNVSDDRGLNAIAYKLGLTAWFWIDEWTTEQKRTVVKNYVKLVTENGNKDLFYWLIDVFDLDVRLVSNRGFILGFSLFPMRFQGDVYQYKFKLPSNYIGGTLQYRTFKLIEKNFVPDYIDIVETY